MQRKIYQKLLDWKNKINRKPLILEGARQVGKTWLMQELGKNEPRGYEGYKTIHKGFGWSQKIPFGKQQVGQSTD